jgi:DNA-directed DNA polymerase III PolC
VYLNCHTWFSLKYGTLSPHQLFDEAKKNNVHKLMVTDIHTTSAYIELLRICRERKGEHELEIAVGIEFRNSDQLHCNFICLARNNEGFEELNRFLSHYNLKELPLPSQSPEFTNVYVIYPWGGKKPQELRENEFTGVKIGEVNKILASPYYKRQDKLVILHPVSFKDKTGFNLHRLLRAIHYNTLLSKIGTAQQASESEIMMPEHELLQYYWQYPTMISNTKRLLEQCRIDFELGTPKNKLTFSGSKGEDHDILSSRALEGFSRRFDTYNSYAMQRLLRELDVIDKLNFEAYFLISLDIVDFATHKNFAHVGRGSGANSLVAYCLGITDVDPIELDLYFERFLNPYRTSPPDFDIDFSWKERDVVTEYILNKYSYNNAALLATFTTIQGRSAIRELGKVFGLPKPEIDAIVAHPHQLRNKDKITQLIFRYAELMIDIPLNLSIHAGGVVITEKPLYAYTATDLPPKGFPITHFDMYGAEEMGIHKYDILSQRGLGHIKDSVEVVLKNQKKEVDVNRFQDFKKDEKIKNLLRKGRTIGCFYVESPAMRQLLGKLECEDYLTLVAASSIIRPGVASSGMMREYIYRHHNPHKFEYIHPKMKELMTESHGVMIYQEDVIKVAHHFAGLGLAEADILRRGMSGKYRSRAEFKRVEDQYFENCKAKGYPDAITSEVWRQIESFSGYSFSKAHSASFAIESYQSLFLKAHYPLEFMVAVINNFGGFYKTEFYFHEARMDGANIEAPCINKSEYLTTIYGKSIFVGFIHLKSLETKLGQLIEKERKLNGKFTCLDNFIRRVPVGLEQISILIKIGAFRFTGKTKRELLWEAHLYFGKQKKQEYTCGLFDSINVRDYKLPQLDRQVLEDAFDELELLEFPLCDPFKLLATPDRGDTVARELMEKLKKQVRMIGYLVTTKDTYAKDRQLMHFGTFYDHQGYVFDTTHFPVEAKKYPFRGKGFYLIKGKVIEDFGYPMIEVKYMEKLPMVNLRESKLIGM